MSIIGSRGRRTLEPSRRKGTARLRENQCRPPSRLRIIEFPYWNADSESIDDCRLRLRLHAGLRCAILWLVLARSDTALLIFDR